MTKETEQSEVNKNAVNAILGGQSRVKFGMEPYFDSFSITHKSDRVVVTAIHGDHLWQYKLSLTGELERVRIANPQAAVNTSLRKVIVRELRKSSTKRLRS